MNTTKKTRIIQNTTAAALFLSAASMALFIGWIMTSLKIAYFGDIEAAAFALPVTDGLLNGFFIFMLLAGSAVYGYDKLKSVGFSLPRTEKMTGDRKGVWPVKTKIACAQPVLTMLAKPNEKEGDDLESLEPGYCLP